MLRSCMYGEASQETDGLLEVGAYPGHVCIEMLLS